MELCPLCKTGLFLKRSEQPGPETVMTLTCRNRSCSNYMQDVAVVRVPAEEPQE